MCSAYFLTTEDTEDTEESDYDDPSVSSVSSVVQKLPITVLNSEQPPSLHQRFVAG